VEFKNFEGIEYQVDYIKIPADRQADGLCYNPEINPIIYVDKDLKDRRKLNVLIEEVFHAHFWDLPEWKARKFAANLGKLVYAEFLMKKKKKY